MAKLLLVDDDIELADTVARWLVREKHTVDVVHTGEEGLQRLQISEYDVVIFDWSLPDLTGIAVCQQFRQNNSATPVLMLTSRAAAADKVTGLDAGADDYLSKPFSLAELSARIRALVRRASPVKSSVVNAGILSLDPRKHTVTRDGAEIHLLPREFALLEFFMRHPGEVFSVESILTRVWPAGAESTELAIRTCIKRIRDKIDVADEHSVIENIPRIGYRFRAD